MSKRFTRALIPCCLFFLFSYCYASSPYAGETVYEVLCNLNAQWKKVTPDADFYHEKPQYTTGEEAIRLHFTLIEHTLRSKNTDQLTPEQKRKRNLHLDRLLAYRDAGKFPSNYDFEEPRPYFIDPVNENVCAVGHLVKEDGLADLAWQIFEEDNNGFVYDLDKTYPLTDWAEANGMTLDELAWIQPMYNWSYTDGVKIGYEPMGGCDYKIKATYYQRCTRSIASLGNFYFTLKSTDGYCLDSMIQLGFPAVSEVQVTPLCPTGQSRCDTTNVSLEGYRQVVIEKDLNLCNLGGTCEQFELIFRTCWRSNGIDCYYSDGLLINRRDYPNNHTPEVLATFPHYIPYSYYLDPVRLSVGAYDADGDSLSYELGPCLTDSAAPVTYFGGIGPQTPMGPNWTVQLDPVTGDLEITPSSNSPGGINYADLCVWIKEWRNGVEINKSTFDVELRPMGHSNRPPVIEPLQNLTGGQLTNGKIIETCVGSQLRFEIPFSDTLNIFPMPSGFVTAT